MVEYIAMVGKLRAIDTKRRWVTFYDENEKREIVLQLGQKVSVRQLARYLGEDVTLKVKGDRIIGIA